MLPRYQDIKQKMQQWINKQITKGYHLGHPGSIPNFEVIMNAPPELSKKINKEGVKQ